MKMENIDFARRYVKLYCDEGDVFTTLRRDSVDNIEKYINREGSLYNVVINGEYAFKAKLLGVIYLESIYEFSKYMLIYETTYYSTDDNKNTEDDISNIIFKYNDAPLMLLMFQKVKDSDERFIM